MNLVLQDVAYPILLAVSMFAFFIVLAWYDWRK